MMKNRFALVILACALVAYFVLVVTGTGIFAKKENNTGKDRLAGLLITKSVFDGEMRIDLYYNRLYATLVDDPDSYIYNPMTGETMTAKKYVFEGVDGICYLYAWYPNGQGEPYWREDIDEGISVVRSQRNSTDAGGTPRLKGTIYVSASKGPNIFFYNPVYQTSSGEVYAVTETSMVYRDPVVGMGNIWTVTVNGENEIAIKDVEITIRYINTPIATSILQFGEDSDIISEKKYASGDLPDTIKVEPGTDFIIVKTHVQSADNTETITRELFQPGDDQIFTFSCREDGICVEQYCSIVWNEDN